jgi:signal peptidase I
MSRLGEAERRPRRDRGLIAAFAVGGVLAVLVTAAVVYLLSDESIPSRGLSMKPTLAATQELDIDFDAYASADPQIGDIVAVNPPSTFSDCRDGGAGTCDAIDDHLIKRIVAGPGDVISFTPQGRAVLNGSAAPEPFILPCGRRAYFCGNEPVSLPETAYFVAGDNRGNSTDSRDFGPVPREAIEGRVLIGDRG